MCLTLDLQGKMSFIDLLALGEVKSMKVGVWPIEIVDMDEVKVATL